MRTVRPGLAAARRLASPRAIRSASAMAPAAAAPLAGPADVTATIDALNEEYAAVHRAFEENFWAVKMGLKARYVGNSPESLASTKSALEAWLGDAANLERARAAAQSPGVSEAQAQTLAVVEKALEVNQLPPAAAPLRERLNTLEAELQAARNGMAMGYTNPETGAFVPASPVQLRNLMRTHPNEAVRKACYAGLRTVGPAVAPAFCDIIKLRNALARALGYADFYEYKVQCAEGFSKAALFDVLGPLEARSRPIMARAAAALKAAKGEDAAQPWNRGYALAGQSEAAMDPYFQFEDAVGVWARSFAALGISFAGSTMRLDLLDRPEGNKYPNGFCHWPGVAWIRPDGTRVPCETNFTSLATPGALGSGRTALTTLAHEGGHAAHFANIQAYTPLASQERAPTSVAYAETQSMFLDALCEDGAWLGRYARDAAGDVIPWAVVEAHLRETRPYAVFGLRAMLAVPFFEKALYELPDAEVTPERVLALADETEAAVEGGPSPRPLMSVPHILADESSCYYHGYVLAEMAVKQTRAALRARGPLVDNPAVGAALRDGYWAPGNAVPYLDLVEAVTGAPLGADAWVADLEKGIEEVVAAERADYDAAVAAGPAIPPGGDADLDMRVLLVHGDETVADSADGGLAAAEARFKRWVGARAPPAAASA